MFRSGWSAPVARAAIDPLAHGPTLSERYVIVMAF